MTEKKEGHCVQLHPDDLWFADLLNAFAPAPRPDVSVSPDDPAVILQNDGTTRTPKDAVGLPRGLVATGLQSHAWLQSVWEDWRDIILLLLPLFHAYGYIGG